MEYYSLVMSGRISVAGLHYKEKALSIGKAYNKGAIILYPYDGDGKKCNCFF